MKGLGASALLAVWFLGMAGASRGDLLWDTLASDPALALASQQNAATATEAADDFFFLPRGGAGPFLLEQITIAGLFSNPAAAVNNVHVELYQSFPMNSDAATDHLPIGSLSWGSVCKARKPHQWHGNNAPVSQSD